MKHIIFEGVDGGGKTALIKGFNWRTGHKHLTSDRWFPSYAVYDYQADLSSLTRLAENCAKLFTDTVIFLVEVNPVLVHERLLIRAPEQVALVRRRKIVDWNFELLPHYADLLVRYETVCREFVKSPHLRGFYVSSAVDYTSVVDELVQAVEYPAGGYAGTYVLPMEDK